MKIALICTEKLPVPPVAGGAIQMYIDGILPYLSQKHDITVYSIRNPELPDEEVRDNVKYIRVPGKTDKIYIGSLKSAIPASENDVGSTPFELIHVFNRPKFLLALSNTFPRQKFSLSLHNEMLHADKISDEAGLLCIEKAEFINTVSKYIADTVVSRFPAARDKMNVVYSGADYLKYSPVWTPEGAAKKHGMKSKFGLQDLRVILYVGRLSIKKGVHILAKAMEKVMQTHPGTALVIAGSKWYGSNDADDYTASLRALADKLPGPVVFTGFIPPAGIADYYCLGDIFVCASQWNEPLARVHYEAMAAGLPIITTNRGGNAEVVPENCGIVIDRYNDPDAMADSIRYLLDRPQLCLSMGKEGRRLAEEKYNWRRVADEIFKPVEQAAAAQAPVNQYNAGQAAAEQTPSGQTQAEPAPVMPASADQPPIAQASADQMPVIQITVNQAPDLTDKSDDVPADTADTDAAGTAGGGPAGTAGIQAPDSTDTGPADKPHIDTPSDPGTVPADCPYDAGSDASVKDPGSGPVCENTLNEFWDTLPSANISIIGTGYVGLVTGVCLASMGRNVICCDQDKTKIEMLNNGVMPIYEPSLKSLSENCVRKHRLSFTTDVARAVSHSDIIFITVSTPTLSDNSCDTSQVFAVARSIGMHMDRYKVVVNKSTVPVGTGSVVKSVITTVLKKRGREIPFDVVSNPEFLREGSAVYDFINPDRIVIGAESGKAAELVRNVYSDQIACGTPVVLTDIETAEMIKYASNAFLATKISFVNEIANLCEACGIDVAKVTTGMGLDGRIGAQFLNPGPGFGGSCFPKDVRALAALAGKYGCETLILDSVLEVNRRQRERMISKVENALGGQLNGSRVTVLGVSFKPGTDDIRESPAVYLISALLERNAVVAVYDPQAMENLKKEHPEMQLKYCGDMYSACSKSECVILATEWKEFSGLDFKRLRSVVKKPVFLDLRNMYEPEHVRRHGFYYEGVGRK